MRMWYSKTFWMPKYVFDRNFMENSVNPNKVNQNMNIEMVFWFSKHALKVSFDIENLIFGNIPGAKKKVFDHNTCNMKIVTVQISKYMYEYRNSILIFKIVH